MHTKHDVISPTIDQPPSNALTSRSARTIAPWHTSDPSQSTEATKLTCGVQSDTMAAKHARITLIANKKSAEMSINRPGSYVVS